MSAIVRPFGVTIVAVIAWINGVVNIIQGIVSLLGGADPTVAWITIFVGIITFLVSLGLFRGSNGARILVTIVFLINIAAAIYAIVAVPGYFFSAVVTGVLALIGILLLYTARANAFFEARERRNGFANAQR